METLELSEVGVEAAAQSAAAVLRAGGVILYPTDTLYGLGADALSDKAVDMIYHIKGREEKKPIHCVVADLGMAEKYAELNEAARALAEAFWPGPLTLLLKKKKGIETGIARGIDTLGIRIPDNEFCLALAREFGKPYTTTSANKSGLETPSTVEAILKQLYSGFVNPNSGLNSGLRNPNIDLMVDAGKLPESLPSTVVDVSSGRPNILRKGAIPAAAIAALTPEISALH